MPQFQAVLFDWAGTTVDYGSRAPAMVFIEIFRRRGIDITEAEARGPMGLSKKEHIEAVCAMPRVAGLWQDVFGRAPAAGDIQAMYDEFLPLQKETLSLHSDVIPGVAEAVAECRRRGMRIGSTTGYTRELMDVVVPLAAKGGYSPDAIVCSDEVAAGRPAPWMNFRAAELLGVYPMNRVIAVDDTPVGIAAANNTGAISIGITQTGNAIGLSQATMAELSKEELESRLSAAEKQFRDAGARHVLRSVAELPALLDELAGGRP